MKTQKSEDLIDAVKKYIENQPQQTRCINHGVRQTICLDRSVAASRKYGDRGYYSAMYEPCPLCEQDRLHGQGAPKNLLTASLDNWVADGREIYLEQVREFIKQQRGFLILLGDVGTGKSHLAVGAMRFFSSAHYVKQNDLLRKLRQSYRDHGISDPVGECQCCDLLVLDDMGISGGGRDELPMIHAILDHRHDEQKPTILTSNLDLNELKECIGERMADRFKESSFNIVKFEGESYRRIAHEKYFSK